MANGWQRELDWLFGLRDRLAHSRMAMEEVVVVRRTRRTVISSVPLALELTAISAERAAVFSRAVVATCVAHPKAATTEWADFAAKLASATFHDGKAEARGASTKASKGGATIDGGRTRPSRATQTEQRT